MLRVSDIVEDEVRQTAFLEGALADGIINHSALARRIRPTVERRLLRRVSVAAVMMALRRLEPRVTRRVAGRGRSLPAIGDLTVRPNLVEFTFHNSATLRAAHRRFLGRVSHAHDGFVTYTQGVSQGMLIVSAGFERAVDEVFAAEARVATLKNLSALVLRLSPAVVKTPGAYYRILKQLAWQNINVIDVVSTYTEFTIILDNGEVNAAFAALRAA